MERVPGRRGGGGGGWNGAVLCQGGSVVEGRRRSGAVSWHSREAEGEAATASTAQHRQRQRPFTSQPASWGGASVVSVLII